MDNPGLPYYFYAGTIEHSVKRPILGKPYFPFFQFVTAGQWVYQSGALLGRARKEKTFALATLLAEPGMAETFHPFLLNASDERLAKRTEPLVSFTDLFIVAEFEKAGATYGTLEGMQRVGKQRIPVEFGSKLLTMWGVEGVSFGIHHPDDVERMWRADYETHEPDLWTEARRSGLDIPEDFTPVTLEEREHHVMLLTAQYAATFHPAMIDELSLRFV